MCGHVCVAAKFGPLFDTRIITTVRGNILTRQMPTRHMLTTQMITPQMRTSLMQKETFADNFFYNPYL